MEKKKMPMIYQAKLFILNVVSDDEVEWVEKAVGIPSFVREENIYKLKFFSQNQNKPFNYEIVVSENISFDRNQTKIITWTLIKENVEMALSFRDQTGANSFWSLIDEYLKKQAIHVQANSNEMFLLQYKIPEPTKETLAQIYSEFMDIPIPERRDRINSILLTKRDLLPKMKSLFECLQREGRKTNQKQLILFFEIMKTIINSSDFELLNELLSEQYYQFTFGCLQYDPPFINTALKHRDFITQQCKFVQVVPFKNKQRLLQVHFIYRLEYIKDCILNHHLEELAQRMLSLIIYTSYKEIIISIFNPKEKDYINQLFNLLRYQDLRAYRLLQEIARQAKNLDLLYTGNKEMQQNVVFNNLAEKQIFQILVKNLMVEFVNDPKQKTKSKIRTQEEFQQIYKISLDLIINSLECDPKYLKNYCTSEQQKVLKYPIIHFFLRNINSIKYRHQYTKIVEYLVKNEENHEIAPIVQQMFINTFLSDKYPQSSSLRIIQKLCQTLSEAFRDRKQECIQKLVKILDYLRNKELQIIVLQTLKKIVTLYFPFDEERQIILQIFMVQVDCFVLFMVSTRGSNNLPLSVWLELVQILKCSGGPKAACFIEKLKSKLQEYPQYYVKTLLKYIQSILDHKDVVIPLMKRDRSSVKLGQQTFESLPEKKTKI